MILLGYLVIQIIILFPIFSYSLFILNICISVFLNYLRKFKFFFLFKKYKEAEQTYNTDLKKSIFKKKFPVI